MSKLQNMKAVKQMMAGTHKSQTRKTFAMSSKKQEVAEEDILERFENGKPKVWIETDPKGFRTKVTQHEGFKSREPENSILKTIQDTLKVPDKCPKCGKDMRDHEKKLNFKFYFIDSFLQNFKLIFFWFCYYIYFYTNIYNSCIQDVYRVINHFIV